MSNVAVKQNNQEDWQSLPIKDFAHTTSGGTPKRGVVEYYNGDVPWVKSGDLNDGHLNKVDEYITELGLEESSAKLFKPGTLLIALYGATIGRLSILNFEASTNQAVCGISVPENVEVKYLFYYLLSIRQKLIDQGKGGAQPNINQQIIKETVVPLAPPEQQKRIVAKIEKLFSHIDTGIKGLKKTKLLLKQYRQSVLKAAVTGELTKEWREANKDKLEPASQLLERILKERRQKWEEQQLEQYKAKGKGKMPKDDKWKENYKEPVDFRSDIEMPERWVGVTTDQVFYYVTSGSRGWAKYYSDDGPIFLRMGNLEHYNVRLDLSDIQKVSPPEGAEGSRTKVEAGDSLISMTADVGMVAIVPDVFEEAYINQHVSLARPVIRSMGLYLAWLLSGDFAKEQFKALQRGATKVGLGLDDIKSIQFGLPAIEEQYEIVRIIEEKLSSIEHLATELDQQLIKAEKSKQSVLTSAFSGIFFDKKMDVV